MTKQDNSLATFCSKITKEQGFVIPSSLHSFELFARYRAFCLFPKISFFSDYFDQIVRIDIANLQNQEINSEVIFKDDNWIQNADGVFLRCKTGYLKISQITLKTGKSINFRGYQFK